ncbi:MAG: hypothetical protein IJP39_08680, partial [Bacteroidales bacterium]|nr:hypothetical protein [Bacteroidales bacterium]
QQSCRRSLPAAQTLPDWSSVERPYRPFGPYGLIAGPNRQRLLRRRASYRPAGSVSLRLPGLQHSS